MMTEFLLFTLFPNSLISLMKQSARWQRWVPVIQRHTTFWRGFFLPPPFTYPLLCPHLDTQTGSEKGLIQKKKKKCVVLLCSLPSTRRQNVRELPDITQKQHWKIHVYHSSSLIDGLSSLYVYGVRGLPVALTVTQRIHWGVQETACSLWLSPLSNQTTVCTFFHMYKYIYAVLKRGKKGCFSRIWRTSFIMRLLTLVVR